MKIKLRPSSDDVAEIYRDHGHFHDGDAGLDLYVPESITFAARETAPIHLKVACEMEGQKPDFLIPRSSISKTPLRMANSIGLIDAGYRGELIAFCDNISEEPYTVKAGHRLFQLVAIDGSPLELEIVDELSETSRGEGGFGSTGS